MAWRHFLSRMLRRGVVRYFDRECFAIDQGQFIPVKKMGMGVLIVSRRHYTERLMWLPTEDFRALWQAAKLEAEGGAGRTVFVIGKAVNGKTPITLYDLDEAVPPVTGVVLPDALMLTARLPEGDAIACHLPDGELAWFGCDVGHMVSQPAKGLFERAEYFMLSHGLAGEVRGELGVEDYREQLCTHWYRLPWRQYAGLFCRKTAESGKWFLVLQQSLLPVALGITLYLVGMVAWLNWLESSTETKLAERGGAINDALELRQQLHVVRDDAVLLKNTLEKSRTYWQMWQPVLPLIQNGDAIESVRLEGDVLVVRVLSASATVSLDTLLQSPVVLQAGFDGPVRKHRGKEVANIRVHLAEVGL